MSRLLFVLGMVAVALGTAIARTQSATADDQDPFTFQFEQTSGHRGLAIQGYIHNRLPCRITNVRVQVESLDANGTRIASASGWVQGDVRAGDRGFFYVPIVAPAPTYRASVETYDKVMLETPQTP